VQNDEALAQRIQQGGQQAMELLVDRYQGPLFAYLYRLTDGDAALAEDLVQESFVRVLRSIEQYQYPRPFKPWLYSIATNLGRDHFKRLSTRQTTYLTEAIANQPDPGSAASPEAVALAQAEATLLRAALLDLPDHQRETLILRYYQEFSLQEIAEIQNLPVGTVKSRLSLGLKRLRSLMEEQE
jgi:RNA polymerase sigma-70 factor (ECF subfamily)